MDCLANPGPSCSSSPPLKKSKVEVEFMLQERISKSTEKISEFWKEDDRTKGSLVDENHILKHKSEFTNLVI